MMNRGRLEPAHEPKRFIIWMCLAEDRLYCNINNIKMNEKIFLIYYRITAVSKYCSDGYLTNMN